MFSYLQFNLKFNYDKKKHRKENRGNVVRLSGSWGLKGSGDLPLWGTTTLIDSKMLPICSIENVFLVILLRTFSLFLYRKNLRNRIYACHFAQRKDDYFYGLSEARTVKKA